MRYESPAASYLIPHTLKKGVMLYPAHWLVAGFVALSLVFWLGMLFWAARSGHFEKSSEAIRYKVFEDDSDRC